MNFVRRGEIDVSMYKSLLGEKAPWKNKWTTARKSAFSCHKNADVIPLMWDGFNEYKPDQEMPKSEFFDAFYVKDFFNKLLLVLGGGKVVSAMLVNLPSRSAVSPHQDGGDFLVKNTRLHIPIFSPAGSFLIVSDQAIHMKDGEIFEISNNLIHSAVNNSDSDRVHLIVDWHGAMI